VPVSGIDDDPGSRERRDEQDKSKKDQAQPHGWKTGTGYPCSTRSRYGFAHCVIAPARDLCPNYMAQPISFARASSKIKGADAWRTLRQYDNPVQ
jgi:hypothetical protein